MRTFLACIVLIVLCGTCMGGKKNKASKADELAPLNTLSVTLTETNSQLQALIGSLGKLIEKIDECSTNPCVNGERINSNQRKCPPEYEGSNCETAINLVRGYLAVSQSSTTHEGVPERAVDGNENTNFNGKSCTHTMSNLPSHWWAVQLGKPYKVNRIVITNRLDCCRDRLNSLDVFVDDKHCGQYEGPPTDDSNVTIMCNGGITGSIVNITKSANWSLTLCEVKVYAE